MDEGYIAIDSGATVSTFVEQCRELRYWTREPAVDQT